MDVKVDPHKLEIFLEVCQGENFSDVAANLGLSKSTISRTLSALEEDLQKKLFERVNKSLILTPEGKYLKSEAIRILDSISSLKMGLENVGSALEGSFTIATTEPLASTWLTRFIHLWIAQHPKINVEINANPQSLNWALHEADVAIRPYVSATGVIQEKLFHLDL